MDFNEFFQTLILATIACFLTLVLFQSASDFWNAKAFLLTKAFKKKLFKQHIPFSALFCLTFFLVNLIVFSIYLLL